MLMTVSSTPQDPPFRFRGKGDQTSSPGIPIRKDGLLAFLGVATICYGWTLISFRSPTVTPPETATGATPGPQVEETVRIIE